MAHQIGDKKKEKEKEKEKKTVATISTHRLEPSWKPPLRHPRSRHPPRTRNGRSQIATTRGDVDVNSARVPTKSIAQRTKMDANRCRCQQVHHARISQLLQVSWNLELRAYPETVNRSSHFLVPLRLHFSAFVLFHLSAPVVQDDPLPLS